MRCLDSVQQGTCRVITSTSDRPSAPPLSILQSPFPPPLATTTHGERSRCHTCGLPSTQVPHPADSPLRQGWLHPKRTRRATCEWRGESAG
ncbi:hypothetical protein IEO21_09031 [Rhodonia placenta]|uniref:Uncharacterized protein n=1 Tax=Rhodonia placenta TaxID=104341 RepID=A0A8H7TYM4_9APHY|nr:hypothetical protein IEO21_09031 [Postia placenta]